MTYQMGPHTGTCDWGGCDRFAEHRRWHHELARWLPVCSEHRAPLQKDRPVQDRPPRREREPREKVTSGRGRHR